MDVFEREKFETVEALYFASIFNLKHTQLPQIL